jgi:hypothetical protein
MKRKEPKPAQDHTEPEAVRRKLVEAYCKLANGRRFGPAERAEFARMAESWAATLSQTYIK